MGTAPEVQAKIVYFGPAGAGTTTNLQAVHQKLKKQHRGELQVQSKDGASYEQMELDPGTVRGYSTSIQVYSLPGAPEHAAIRRELLEGVHGLVLVADLRPERHEATLEATRELNEHLAHYGRTLDDVVLVIQYNHRDLVDENAIDALHRQLGLSPAAHFEAVAREGTGVLQTLTTLSKLVLARLRRDSPVGAEELNGNLEAQALELDTPDKGFRLESAGPAEGSEGEIQLPICLVDEASGRRVELRLRLSVS